MFKILGFLLNLVLKSVLQLTNKYVIGLKYKLKLINVLL